MRLRSVARRGRFDERRIRRDVRLGGVLGLDEGLATLRLGRDAESPFALLARVFLGGEAVDRRLVAPLFDPLPGELLEEDGGVVRSRQRVEPFGGLLVASDWPRRPRRDHVLGIGGGTRLLAALTPRRPVESALDLCTGSGALALLAAQHADRVVAVDLNPRALRLAVVNAALNGVRGVDWRRGDLYRPVRGEIFDLIVANPPFIVSPSNEFLFRDSDREDDSLTRAVVAGAAEHLSEGGYALVIGSWVVSEGGRWSTAPRAWLKGAGCDAWLLRDSTESPSAYALQWNLRPGRTLESAAAAAGDWVDYYRRRGISAIATGIVILRRRKGRNWVRADELMRRPVGAAGPHVERVFAAADLLRSLDADQGLLDLRLVPAPKTMLVERRHPSGAFERARLAVEEGLPLTGRLPEECVGVIAALDGRRTVRRAIAAARASEQACLPVMRDLLARGLLAPA
ncbi:MAG: methyltransferase [Gaiellaceae bacterium]